MLEATIRDSGFILSMRWMLGVIFIVGVIHKIKSPGSFIVTLSGYRLLPDFIITPAAYVILAGELLATVMLFLNLPAGGAVALLLLLIYTIAILVNLLRGRRDIDCGCAGPAVRQTLSAWLVYRNIGLMAVSALTMLVTTQSRQLQLLDWFVALAAATTFSLMSAAATQLSSTSKRFRR